MAAPPEPSAEPLGRDTFYAHLRQLRANAGISQQVAARAAGVSVSSWSNYENGAQVPPIWRAASLARALAVSLDELLDPNPDRVHIANLTITPQALARIRKHGKPELERVAERIAAAATAQLAAVAATPRERKPLRTKRPVVPRAAYARRRIRARQLEREQAARGD